MDINVKLENPAKTSNAETKTIEDGNLDQPLPDNDQNKELNLNESCIKTEPSDDIEVEVVEIKMNTNENRATKRNSEVEETPSENPEIKKIKAEQIESVRRRSLRNETAASVKKKPPKYEEIFNCYKRKEYKECIIYLELVSGSAKDCVEYSILKAACLIHLGIKIAEAHKILDDVLKLRPNNVFTIYAKGLAYYHEQKYRESIKYFERSLELDKPSMQRAEVMLRMAKEQMEKQEFDQEKSSIQPEEEDDEEEIEDNEDHDDPDEDDDGEESSDYDEDDDLENPNETKDARNIRNKRFGCELCGKYFGKKFNLDRHNKTIHDRDTPFIPPLSRKHGKKSEEEKIKTVDADEVVEVKDEIDDDTFVDIDEDQAKIPTTKKKQKFKIRLGAKVAKVSSVPSLAPLKSGLARCKVCNKSYRKGSLARHEIIHTGNKPHKCDQCPMAFYQKSDLQRHLTIHSDNFDFECELCDKKFRIKKNLQVHNKRHHSNLV